MPRLEVQSFLDFAPHYFTYITGAVQQKVGPLLLVPIASKDSISVTMKMTLVLYLC